MGEEIYDPHERPSESYIKFWGTRGSIPVSGAAYSSFGGHTCCLEIRRPGKSIIIDAGTGIRSLGDELLKSSVREVHLFFGHTHWDHIIGLPFFHPLFEADFAIHFYTLEHTIRDVKEAITRVLSPEYFPVRFEDIHAAVTFHEVGSGKAAHIDDLEISVTRCDHPGGALGFRIASPKRTFGYVTDNEFLKGYLGPPQKIGPEHRLLEPYRRFVDFFQGLDLLVHEAQYTPQAYREKIGWGHSSISNATALAKLCAIREWWVTHHDPVADDEELRRRLRLHQTVLEDCELDCKVHFAYDGLLLL